MALARAEVSGLDSEVIQARSFIENKGDDFLANVQYVCGYGVLFRPYRPPFVSPGSLS
jgi:hypothetical protein